MYKPIELDYDNLFPYLSNKTITLHYQRYLSYVDKLNELINVDDSLINILNNISNYPVDIRDDIIYNIGGILNHELYFKSISNQKNNLPTNKLKEDIYRFYGSFDNFKKEFIKTANYLTGSGYTFLVLNKDKLEIINMSNQETPYLYGLIPIFNIDLWEHAYFNDYGNNRASYIMDFFKLLDFKEIGEQYEKIKFQS